MRYAWIWAAMCLYGMISLMISRFFVSYATAQDKVVIIPLFKDEGGITSTQPAPAQKTGQTSCYDQFGMVIDCFGNSGQDGDLQKGVAWPNPRFTDNLTGLNCPHGADIFYGLW